MRMKMRERWMYEKRATYEKMQMREGG